MQLGSDQTKPALGEIRPEFLATITENMRLHLSAMLDQPSVPVALRATSFEADHSVNRRLRRLRVMQDGVLSYGVSAGFNPRGSRDEMVTALIVGDPDEPKAIVWNYACHPTAFPDHSSVSPDFPGVVRAALREHFTNPVLPVLFLQGFSGDTRPPSRWRPRGWKDLVKRMLWGPVFSDFDDAKYRTWSESLAEVVVAGIARDSTLLHPELQIERLELPRSDFVIEATPQSIPMVFQAIRVGDLMIAGASAEVVSGYSSIVRGASQFAMPTGCLDTPIGYIPTASQLREGGYESGDFCRAFGLGGVSDKIAVHAAEGLTAVVIAASRREPPSASGQA